MKASQLSLGNRAQNTRFAVFCHHISGISSLVNIASKGFWFGCPCMDCEIVYIGETGRSLEKRVSEHKCAVKTGDRRNGAVHAWDTGHKVNWDGTEVLKQYSNYWKRRTIEAIWIHISKHNSNLDCGLTLNQMWLAHLEST